MALPPKRSSIPQSPRTATRVEDFAQQQSWYVTCLSVWSDDSSSFSWLFVTLLLFLAKGIITTLEELSLHQEELLGIDEILGTTCRKLKILYLQNNVIDKMQDRKSVV